MQTREDTRITKTKTKLTAAFKALLSEKSFEEISINEICLAADVRRATFYNHFSDKYAFLKSFVGSLRLDFDRRLPSRKKPGASSDYYVEYIRGIVNFFIENEKIAKNALESDVLPSLMEVIKEKNYEDTLDRLKQSVREGMTLPASVEITASMMTGAVANTLLAWFKGGKEKPVEDLICEISAVIAKLQN